MKYVKIFRILGLAIILSLFAIFVPMVPALATNTITIDPEEGKIGDNITVSSEDFTSYASTSEVDYAAEIYFAKEDVL